MDKYLKCLYDYVVENISAARYPDIARYRSSADAQDRAWIALREALTPDQLRLVEDYQTACSGLSVLEDELLFQSAVALGKWMARP